MNIVFSIPAIGWLIIAIVFYAGGEYLSKAWALGPSVLKTVLVLVAYSLGILAWLPALLQKNQLAVTGTLWSIMALITTVSIGIIVFHEHVGYLQIIGLALAFVATILLSI